PERSRRAVLRALHDRSVRYEQSAAAALRGTHRGEADRRRLTRSESVERLRRRRASEPICVAAPVVEGPRLIRRSAVTMVRTNCHGCVGKWTFRNRGAARMNWGRPRLSPRSAAHRLAFHRTISRISTGLLERVSVGPVELD